MILIVGGSYQGKKDFAKEKFPEYSYLFDLQNLIRDELKAKRSKEQILDLINEKIGQEPFVITVDEVGNGVVPLDKNDREFRQVCGEISIELARRATEVYRVSLGIGVRIK